ncbi:uncharacterized protein LOC110489625 isoform X3 [Oncorhynchus mykiss]|uniref:uncharacterized protein LOC110489625 isoform X3 n=1 Tax=Oncorhynchus mykiss TaxID=8022 RepID=UPI0018785511|nr:uncharacterized protein LOC110489625 isoform X3 [Oncorhynchus mykiss]
MRTQRMLIHQAGARREQEQRKRSKHQRVIRKRADQIQAKIRKARQLTHSEEVSGEKRLKRKETNNQSLFQQGLKARKWGGVTCLLLLMTYLLGQTLLTGALYSGTPRYHLKNGNISSLKWTPSQMEAQLGLRREQRAEKVEEKPHQEQQVKKAEEKPHQEQKGRSCKEKRSCRMKEMGISPRLTFQLLPGLHNEQLKLGAQQNNDHDRARAIEDKMKTMHSHMTKMNDKNRKRREEPVEQGEKTGRLDRFKFSVPPQLLTEPGEQRTVSVWKKKPLPEEPLCGWTHHMIKGEVIWDPKGCDLILTKYEEGWEFIMNKITPAEGEEFEIEIARTGLTEGNSYKHVKLGPTPAPEQEQLVTTKVTTTTIAAAVTTTVAAAVTTTATTTKMTSTALAKQTTVTIKTPVTPEPKGFFNEIWNFLTNSNDLPQDKNNAKMTDIGISDSEPFKDTMQEEEVKNEWYKWAKYTANKHRMDNCILCSKSPLSDLMIVPEPASFKNCANWKNDHCTKTKYSIPLCDIECRIAQGSTRGRIMLNETRLGNNDCAAYDIKTESNGLNLDISTVVKGKYECFYSYNTEGINVGNTTVECDTIWILETAGVRRSTDKGLIVNRKGVCGTITQVAPSLTMLKNQDRGIADSFWMCGKNKLMNVLPDGWIGLCALVRAIQQVTIIKSPHDDYVKFRVKRAYEKDPEVYLDAIGQPRGVPQEFKARDEVKSGFESIFLWVTPNKNLEWINYIYYNQQRFINYTDSALTALGEQVQATSKMTWQNRQALNWLLAEKGGVCVMFGDDCCTFIPNNTAPNGSFALAMNRLKGLRTEVKANAGFDSHVWDWLDLALGKWGAMFARMAIMLGGGLVALGIVFCCVLPLVKSLVIQTTVKQMSIGRANLPVVVDPVPGSPGHYTDRYGQACNAAGGPLDCPFGNPNCLFGVVPGGGYACHGFRKDGLPVYAISPESEECPLVHVHEACHLGNNCKWCTKYNEEGHNHYGDPLFCAKCQRGDCDICSKEDCTPM